MCLIPTIRSGEAMLTAAIACNCSHFLVACPARLRLRSPLVAMELPVRSGAFKSARLILAVQEALMAAHKHLHQFREHSQMSTWLTTIVCNCARMQLRKRPRQIHLPLDEQIGENEKYFISERLGDTRPSPEDECRSSELAVHLRKCITLLSPSLRRTFQLRVVEGLSIFETAQALGLPHGTVKTQLARARRKLARYMQRVLESRSRKLSARTAQAAGGK
jgi:RNA polymerase sigma factor (sigma-70 family)